MYSSISSVVIARSSSVLYCAGRVGRCCRMDLISSGDGVASLPSPSCEKSFLQYALWIRAMFSLSENVSPSSDMAPGIRWVGVRGRLLVKNLRVALSSSCRCRSNAWAFFSNSVSFFMRFHCCCAAQALSMFVWVGICLARVSAWMNLRWALFILSCLWRVVLECVRLHLLVMLVISSVNLEGLLLFWMSLLKVLRSGRI